MKFLKPGRARRQAKIDKHDPPAAPKREHVGPDYHKDQSKMRRVVIGVVILVIIAGGAGAGYWFFLREKPASNKPTQSSQTNQTQVSNKIATATKHHASTNFNLEFDHPEDWAVVDEPGTGQLLVRSPFMQMPIADAKNVELRGQFILMIRNKQQPLPEFDAGNAVAGLASQKIDYVKPSSSQRGSTYISFVRHANSSPQGISGIYITGDTGYTEGQAIPKADFTAVDPIISVIFGCKDPSCEFEDSPLNLKPETWQDPDFLQPVLNMLKSLVIT